MTIAVYQSTFQLIFRVYPPTFSLSLSLYHSLRGSHRPLRQPEEPDGGVVVVGVFVAEGQAERLHYVPAGPVAPELPLSSPRPLPLQLAEQIQVRGRL